MKSKTIDWTIRTIAVLALASGTSMLAQDWRHKEFRGEINAYSPQTTKIVNGITTASGPYEVRGPWSLKIDRDADKAEFSAALNMEFSDGWVLTPSGGNGNFDPSVRGAHTHHITMADGDDYQASEWRISGLRSGHRYAQWRRHALCTNVIFDHCHHGWRCRCQPGYRPRRIFQYHGGIWRPGQRPFWNGASFGRCSKCLERRTVGVTGCLIFVYPLNTADRRGRKGIHRPSIARSFFPRG